MTAIERVEALAELWKQRADAIEPTAEGATLDESRYAQQRGYVTAMRDCAAELLQELARDVLHGKRVT